MNRPFPNAAAILAFVISIPASTAAAQCPEWSPDFQAPGVDGYVYALLDDIAGAPAEMIVGGQFLFAGTERSPNVARWDGVAWQAMGDGLDGTVRALAQYDDGSGLALYAGGVFQSPSGTRNLARFDGAAWSYLGPTPNFGDVVALEVYDDGSGPALYFGGLFSWPTIARIGRFDGSFSALGQPAQDSGIVRGLEVHDDGSGARLFAAGQLSWMGGQIQTVAAWDGLAWAGVPGLANQGFEGAGVHALQSYDDGSGAKLYASGNLSLSAGSPARVAEWNGVTWAGLPGTLVNGIGNALAVHDAGGGAGLYIGGLNTLLRYDGSTVQAIQSPGHDIRALGSLGTSVGTSLVSGSGPEHLDLMWPNGIALLEGSTWRTLSAGGGIGGGFDGMGGIRRLEGPDGPQLLCFGAAGAVAGQQARSLARYEGGGWIPYAPLPASLSSVVDVAWYDEGSGGELHAISYDSGGTILRFASSAWETLPSLPGSGGLSFYRFLETMDFGQGERLVVGGDFTGPSGKHLAAWDGQSWQALGGGLEASAGNFFDQATSSVKFATPGGERLVVAGNFEFAGGTAVRNIAAWDGDSWDDLGGGVATPFGSAIRDVEVYGSPAGPLVVVAGEGLTAAGVGVPQLMLAWDGTAWAPFGSGASSGDRVRHLGVFDLDGGGERLIASGVFSSLDGVPADGSAIWDGQSWSEFAVLENPLLPNPSLTALAQYASFDDGTGRALFLAGRFSSVDGVGASSVARYRDPCGLVVGEPYCPSQPNSSGNSARLRAQGSSSLAVGQLEFLATELPPDQSALLVFGLPAGSVALGNGTLCLGGSIVRVLPVTSSTATGQFTLPFDYAAPYANSVVPGATFGFQTWFRDPQAGAANSNLTDGLRIHFAP